MEPTEASSEKLNKRKFLKIKIKETIMVPIFYNNKREKSIELIEKM